MRRVLITGGGGFLGSWLIRSAPEEAELHATRRTSPVAGCPSHHLDLAEADAVAALWEHLQPELVIHTAYTMEAGERDIWAATRNVVDASERLGAELVHLSSDLVLDGEAAPYAESALPKPVNEYGRWKAKAEDYVRERLPAAAVVRTSLITSFNPPDPRTAWVAAGLRGEHPLILYTDEIRCPIRVEDLASQIWEIAALGVEQRTGVWHLAGPEALSRFSLGLLIAARLQRSPDAIVPAVSAASPTPRPRDLRLLTSRADAALRTRPAPVALPPAGIGRAM